jgi:lysophospholipase L1-like esterase
MSAQKELLEIKTRLTSSSPLTWVFTGDSITQGAAHTYGHRSFPEIFAEHVRWEISRKMDIVINSGISGNKSSDVLESLEWRVLRFKPDVVFLMIGTNDSTLGENGKNIFEINLTTLIKKIRSSGCFCILNTPNAICLDGYSNAFSMLPDYVQIIRRVAEVQDVMVIDHFVYWNQIKTTKDELMSWLDDSIHPNMYGHHVIANSIFKYLAINDEKPSCRFWIP